MPAALGDLDPRDAARVGDMHHGHDAARLAALPRLERIDGTDRLARPRRHIDIAIERLGVDPGFRQLCRGRRRLHGRHGGELRGRE